MTADTANLDANQNRLLAALTIAAARELAGDTVLLDEGDRIGSNTRMARVWEIVLIDHPADKAAPRLICVYLVDLLDGRNGGKKFKFEPSRMLYAYEWLHKAEPAEFRAVLVKDPAIWFGYVGLGRGVEPCGAADSLPRAQSRIKAHVDRCLAALVLRFLGRCFQGRASAVR